ncbi:MAG: HEPN domain-containing protein [Desulfomonilaceae bacterium]
MPSQAFQDFDIRLGEVQQLLDAHNALTRLGKAEASLAAGQDLQNIATVIQHLVTTPGPGRPTEVYALNSAAIALLSGHLQGFVVDLFREVAGITLSGKIRDVQTLTDTANTRGNPNPDNINKLFGSLGFPKVLDGLAWQKMSNQALLKKLRNFNELRNKIVHGRNERVTKQKVSNHLKVLKNFALHLDRKLRSEVHHVTAEYPW